MPALWKSSRVGPAGDGSAAKKRASNENHYHADESIQPIYNEGMKYHQSPLLIFFRVGRFIKPITPITNHQGATARNDRVRP